MLHEVSGNFSQNVTIKPIFKKWAEDLNGRFPKKTYRWPRDTWKKKKAQHH